MSRYIQITNSEQRPVFYAVADGTLYLDRYAVMLMWAKHINAVKAENLYLRTKTEYYYRIYKGMEPPGPGELDDYMYLIDKSCYFETTEIQDAIDFIENDILPSLETYSSVHGKWHPLVEEWGGTEVFESYFENNKGNISLSPDFNEDDLLDGAHNMSHVFAELKAVLQDSLDSGEPYDVYVH